MLSTIAFTSAVALVVALDVLYGYNIVKWGNYANFGFGFRAATGIRVVGLVTEHGRQAGIRVGDRILEVNGEDFTNYQEFRAAMHRDMGEKNTYLLERDGEQLQVTVTNIPMGLKGAFRRSGIPYILGLCYALIGVLVFLMKPHQRTSWIFFFFSVTISIFLTYLYRTGVIRPFWLENVAILAYTFTPAVLIHLALGFPEERNLIKRYQYAQSLPYIASAVLFLCIRSVAPVLTDMPGTLLIVAAGYITAGVLVFLGSCLQIWAKSASEIAKLRSKMILLGFAIAVSLPLVDFVVNTLFHVYIVPSFTYYLPFFIIFPLSIGYSIVKHDLFDIDAIIKRTYGYVLTSGGIAGVYALFVFVTNLAFGRFEFTRSPMFPLIFILAVVFLFNPVRNRVQKFIDRVFYRLEYDYQETVQRISETMRSLLNLEQIVKSIMDTALGVMFIDRGCLLLLNREKQAFECLALGGEGYDQTVLEGKMEHPPQLKLALHDPFIEKLSERKKEVTKYDIQEDPFYEQDKEECKETFERLEATLVVPLVHEERLMGLISLGDKKSGKFYRREDINLLNTLANQGAVAIENAMLVEEVIEKERMEEELSIARDLQMSMLPTACPQIEGFEIAALSIPAREVGGDFYDFIEMGKDKAGLVIGDVTGKSISGALVMSASRSVFRMLSEEQLTVGDIMIRANRRTKKDIKSGMFVALLYAVLNASDRTLSLCSAGQTQPIHLCAERGDASLVQTQGDSFPLGILEDADYQETRLQLAPGDKVVFYTDGIVEAMNEQEEIFGFDRLLEVVRGGSSKTADVLLKEVIDSVHAFAGKATQHDDLTVIALNVVK